MSERIPCPTCGTENGPDAPECRICGYRLDLDPPDASKCARCGSGIGPGFEFCQICGLRLHSRRPRPATQSLRLIPRPRAETGAPVVSEPAAAAAAPVGGAITAITGPPVEAGLAAAPVSAAITAITGPPAEGGLTATPVGGAITAITPGPPPGFNTPAPQPGPPVGSRTPVPQPGPLPVQAAISGSIDAKPGPVALTPEALDAMAAGAWSPPAASSPSAAAPGAGPTPAQRRAPGASQLRLVLVRRDGSEGEVVPLGDAPLTIGRWQGDLRFPSDEFLGPAHARVDPLPGGVRVVDLGTHNGVFVRITRPEVMLPGDRFLLGHHLLRLENVPATGREPEVGADGVRGFGTPLQAAWGRLVLLGPGGSEAETHYLRPPQVVFGRELGDIVFPADPFVSWQHAQLSMELRAGVMAVTLTDLRSANGTYLRAREDVMLQPGDMFRVGDQIFRVRMH